jgi:formylglycine-generating enzyme required for sulfatase activity
MGRAASAWPLLKHSPDPRARSYLIHRLGPLGADPRALLGRLAEEPDVTIRRALILGLGEFDEKELAPDERNEVVQQLRQLYRTAADPGLHAAAEWLLRCWGDDPWLRQREDEWAKDEPQREQTLRHIEEALAKDGAAAKPRWYVNGQGQTMVVIPGPAEFLMGSPATEAGRGASEVLHRERIERPFAVASKPVTVEQFRRFRSQNPSDKNARHPRADEPMAGVLWFEAAAYCNRLSEQEGMPPTEWCYEPKAANQYAEGMRMAPDHRQRRGYRLPTEAEWEYACRAGALTSRCYGQTEELLGKYAWYLANAREQTRPVGRLKPNDLGLFDVHGNVWTWCQERLRDYRTRDSGMEDKEDIQFINGQEYRVMRGGSFAHPATDVRSAARNSNVPSAHFKNVGFRPVRTFR